MPIPTPRILVLAWTSLTGLRLTGRLIRRDGNDFPEFEPCPEAKACVWSRDLADRPRGEAYAAQEGANLLELEDTPDVLKIARRIVLTADAPAQSAPP
jgi:hypothetical protein